MENVMKEFLEKIGYVRYETRVDFWNSSELDDGELSMVMYVEEDFPCYLKRINDFYSEYTNSMIVVFDRLDVEVLG